MKVVEELKEIKRSCGMGIKPVIPFSGNIEDDYKSAFYGSRHYLQSTIYKLELIIKYMERDANT